MENPIIPSAFSNPYKEIKDKHGNIVDNTFAKGMSLEDYFAAQVLPNVLAEVATDVKNDHSKIAEISYDIAEAMIKERYNRLSAGNPYKYPPLK